MELRGVIRAELFLLRAFAHYEMGCCLTTEGVVVVVRAGSRGAREKSGEEGGGQVAYGPE